MNSITATTLLLLLILAGFVDAALSFALEPDASLQQIIADWNHRQRRDSRVKYVAEGTATIPKGSYTGMIYETGTSPFPPKDHTYERKTTLILDFDRNLARKEMQRDNLLIEEREFERQYQINLFDGSETQVFRPRNKNSGPGGYRAPHAIDLFIKPERYQGAFFEVLDYPFFFAHGIFPSPDQEVMPKSLRIAVDATFFQVQGTATLNGRRHAIVRSKPLSGTHDSYYELWVDVERESAVSRYIEYWRGKEERRFDADYQYVHGGWRLKSWKMSALQNDKLFRAETQKVKQIVVNPQLDESLFHIKLVPGMIVSDEINDKQYEVPQPGQRPRSRIEVYMASQRSNGNSISLYFWLVIALTATILIAGIVLWRRRVMSKRHD